MRKLLSNGLVMFAGIISVPAIVVSPQRCWPPADYRQDPRVETLQKFFQEVDCPAKYFVEEFLRAADEHNLDWRLLPSLSLVESGGGREARNNNLFGWGDASFDTIGEAIKDVASRLANSKVYRDKDLDEKLRTYNPSADYPGVVKSVMRRISPSEGF